jgi:WD40 repeat protein
MSLVATCSDVVRCWSWEDRRDGPALSVVREATPHDNAGVNGVTWNHNNQVIATAGGDGSFALVHESGAILDKFTATSADDPLMSVAFNSKSRYLVAGSRAGKVDMWDLKKKLRVRSFGGHSSAIASAVFDPSDESVVSGGASGIILLHKIRSGSVAAEFQCQGRGPATRRPVACLKFNAHRTSQLASAHGDGMVRLWSLESGGGGPIVEWTASGLPAESLAFSPLNDKLLACGVGDGCVHLYDSRDYKSLSRSIATGSSCINSLDFHYQGSMIAAGSADGFVYLLDLRAVGDAGVARVMAHPGEGVKCVAWQHAPRDKDLLKTAGPSASTPGGTSSGVKRVRESATKSRSPAVASTSTSTINGGGEAVSELLRKLEGVSLPSPPPKSSFASQAQVAPPSTPAAAASSSAALPSSLNRHLLKEIVAEVVESARLQIHTDVQNLHLDLLRQFQEQAEDISAALDAHAGRMSALVEENRQLRVQNEELRRAFG